MHGKPYRYEGYLDHAEDIRITRWDLRTGKTERYTQTLGQVVKDAGRHAQAAKRPTLTDTPTFLFHAITFRMDEISPQADRVAFSDGDNLCVYDDTAGKVVTQVKIPQKPAPQPIPRPMLRRQYRRDPRPGFRGDGLETRELAGVWWQTNDTLLIGVGLLGSPPARYAFYSYDIPSKTLSDKSDVLLPLWLGSNETRTIGSPTGFARH